MLLCASIFISYHVISSKVYEQFKNDSYEKTQHIAKIIRNDLLVSDYHAISKTVSSLHEAQDTAFVSVVNNFGDIISENGSMNTKENKVLITNLSIVSQDDFSGEKNILGKIVVAYKYPLLQEMINQQFSVITAVIITLYICFLGSFLVISRSASNYFQELLTQFKKLLDDDIVNINKLDFIKEFHDISINLKKVSVRILETRKIKEEYRKKLAISELASQVTHDIRSPLSALNVAMSDLNSLPETTRLIIRSSIQRIQDIANNLSIKRRRQLNLDDTDSKELHPQLLSSCIEEIISEKRMHFRSQLGINIEGNLVNSYGLFASINLIEFKRVLSNTINNAIEASEKGQGNIVVHLGAINASELQIVVEDDGKGIPPEILSKLGNKGASFGKENNKHSGHGLGLHHAKSTIESWNGSFKVESEVGLGTKVIFTLPKVTAPNWFVSGLEIAKNSAILILDDDQGIHQTWDKKFKEACLAEAEIKIFHVSNPNDFSSWVKKNSSCFDKVTYLCDYELIGHKQSGLDLIEKHLLGPNSILVTSHYEEEEIQTRCMKAGVKLIPKMITAHVPVKVSASSCIDNNVTPLSVLLDDDSLVRMTWKMQAEQTGIDIKIFEDPNELFSSISEMKKNSIFYIDSCLSNDQKGEDVAKKLYNMGYENLYIATGYESENFKHLDYIKGVIGKKPPWDC